MALQTSVDVHYTNSTFSLMCGNIRRVNSEAAWWDVSGSVDKTAYIQVQQLTGGVGPAVDRRLLIRPLPRLLWQCSITIIWTCLYPLPLHICGTLSTLLLLQTLLFFHNNQWQISWNAYSTVRYYTYFTLHVQNYSLYFTRCLEINILRV